MTQKLPEFYDYDLEARQTWRLQQFLKYDTAVEVMAAVAVLVMFGVYGSPALLVVGTLLVGNTLLLLWASRQVARGAVEPAVTATAVGLWIIAAAVAVLLPPAFVVAPLILMESVIVALPYTSRRRLLQLIAGVVTVALALMPFARVEAGPFPLDMLPEAFILGVLIVSVPTVMGLMLYFVWQYSDLLAQTLAKTQTANHALQRSEQELADKLLELHMSRTRIVQVQEGVRREIASHLHGRVQGRLLVLRGRLLESLQKSEPSLEVASHIRECADALAQIVEEDLSALSRRLYPAILRRGLVPALESLADHFDAAVAVQLELDPLLRREEQAYTDTLPESVRLAVYRIAEEALNNVVKHAGATTVSLRLEMSLDRTLRLALADDGRGFDADVASGGLGLAAIHDHAGVVGGVSAVHSAPGAGTEVVVTVPLRAPDRAPQRTGVLSG